MTRQINPQKMLRVIDLLDEALMRDDLAPDARQQLDCARQLAQVELEYATDPRRAMNVYVHIRQIRQC
jgi:hypothetical protein